MFLAAMVGVGSVMPALPPVVPMVYVIASALAFVAYALDKAAAITGRWRTPEHSLHLLALSGGWPGALLAQQVFRHKTAKRSFRAIFWTTVLLNCAVLAWLLIPAIGVHA